MRWSLTAISRRKSDELFMLALLGVTLAMAALTRRRGCRLRWRVVAGM